MRTLLLLALAALLAAPTAWADGRGEGRARARDRAADRAAERVEEHRSDVDNRTRDPSVNHRQRRQASRIARGVRRGSLTKDDAQGLVARKQSLAATEAAFKADGALSADERKQLQRQLGELSHDIFEEKHDGEVARWRARCDHDGVTGKEAREHLKNAQRLVDVRQQLDSAPDAQRPALEAEQATLIDGLYEEDVL